MPVMLLDLVGTKVTVTMQLLPMPMLAPQVLVWVKLGSTAMLVTSSAVAPVLVTVMLWGALLVPTVCEP